MHFCIIKDLKTLSQVIYNLYIFIDIENITKVTIIFISIEASLYLRTNIVFSFNIFLFSFRLLFLLRDVSFSSLC